MRSIIYAGNFVSAKRYVELKGANTDGTRIQRINYGIIGRYPR